MRMQLPAFMNGSAAEMRRSGAVQLTCTICASVARGISPARPMQPKPAQLTSQRTSGVSTAASSSSMMRAASSSARSSARTRAGVRARPAMVCRRFSRRAMSQSSSSPSASSRRAYQAPRPLDAPVMMAMFMEILPVRRHSQKFPTLYQIYK